MTEQNVTTEEMTLKFLGRMKGNNRFIYNFENQANLNYPHKFAAFDNPPECKEEHWYKLIVQHKPMSDGKGTYHNIARKTQDGPYLIEEVSAPAIPAPAGQSTIPADQKKEIPQRKFGDPYVDPREKYWQNKFEFDKLVQIEIRRESALKSAIEYAKVISTVEARVVSIDTLLDTADRFEKDYIVSGRKTEKEEK